MIGRARAPGVAARVLAWLLVALVAAGLADRLFVLLGLLGAFRLHLAAIAGALFAGALVFRSRRVAVPAGIAAVLALATLGPVWRSAERPPAAPGVTLTLLFANVRETNPVPAAMEAALLAPGADVVVVAEAPEALRGGPLARRYPHRAAGPKAKRARTTVWSRYPLEDMKIDGIPGFGPMAVAAAVRLGPDTRLRLLGLHFARTTARRIRGQLDGLAGVAPMLDPPLVAIGDFNAAPWSHVVSRSAALTGTRPAGGYRVTWRGRYPVIDLPAVFGHSIDHLLVSPGLGIASLATVEIPGSDHLGLLAELVVPSQGAPAPGSGAGLSPAAAADYVPTHAQ